MEAIAMSLDDNALTAKVGARAATLEEREAWKAENMRRHAQWLATQAMPPEKSLEERQRIKERADRKVARDEARRLTVERYHRYLVNRAARLTSPPAVAGVRKSSTLTRTPRRCVVRTPRSRRRVRRARARAPVRLADDDPLDPPARVIYEHAARFRGDPRVARWLESWADEALEGA